MHKSQLDYLRFKHVINILKCSFIKPMTIITVTLDQMNQLMNTTIAN